MANSRARLRRAHNCRTPRLVALTAALVPRTTVAFSRSSSATAQPHMRTRSPAGASDAPHRARTQGVGRGNAFVSACVVRPTRDDGGQAAPGVRQELPRALPAAVGFGGHRRRRHCEYPDERVCSHLAANRCVHANLTFSSVALRRQDARAHRGRAYGRVCVGHGVPLSRHCSLGLFPGRHQP
jgi:hypothetical protein